MPSWKFVEDVTCDSYYSRGGSFYTPLTSPTEQLANFASRALASLTCRLSVLHLYLSLAVYARASHYSLDQTIIMADSEITDARLSHISNYNSGKAKVSSEFCHQM